MILLNNSIIYIALGILLQLLVDVKPQTIFKPDLRYGHTATFINDKLYIIGGAIPPDIETPKEIFLYLDFSVSFNTNDLKWNDLSATVNNIFPPHRYAAAIKGGVNNSTLFLYGGDNFHGQKLDSIYTFDTQNNLWNIPKITGNPPTGKVGAIPIIDYNGLIYLFGGVTSNSDGSGVYTNGMFVLNTINLSWKTVNSINAPSPRASYGAVFLPNKNIIYIGGYNKDFEAFPLDEVYVYDTINDIWLIKKAYGSVPIARYSFSSVLGLDEQRIIIFGGFGPKYRQDLNPDNSLYVLDLNNFNWNIPKVTGKIPSSRAFHKSVLIEKYMVVTFGIGYIQGVESDILLLDISNNDEYIWTTSFEPLFASSPSVPPSSATTDTTQPNIKTNTSGSGVIVGTVIGSLIGGSLLTIGSFVLYKQYKNKKERSKAIPTF